MIYQRRLFLFSFQEKKKEKRKSILVKQAIFFHQGDYNAKLTKVVLRAFTPEVIKNLIPNIESIAKDSLQSFEGRLINTFQEMKTVSYWFLKLFFFFTANWNRARSLSLFNCFCLQYKFNVSLLSIFGKKEVLYWEDMKRTYYILEKGYN